MYELHLLLILIFIIFLTQTTFYFIMAHIKTETITNHDFETINRARTHTVYMDNMPEHGGNNFGATPKEHLCMALGSCTTMTIKTYLLRKQWDCKYLQVNTNLDIQNGVSTFTVHIMIKGDFDEKQQNRIKQIAKLCPVYKMISAGNTVVKTFEFG